MYLTGFLNHLFQKVKITDTSLNPIKNKGTPGNKKTVSDDKVNFDTLIPVYKEVLHSPLLYYLPQRLDSAMCLYEWLYHRG